MKDKALERNVLELARRAGIEGGRVFEVNMSRDTKITGAYVQGLIGVKRIVVYDTTIAKANEYRPWETGQRLRYGYLFK